MLLIARDRRSNVQFHFRGKETFPFNFCHIPSVSSWIGFSCCSKERNKKKKKEKKFPTERSHKARTLLSSITLFIFSIQSASTGPSKRIHFTSGVSSVKSNETLRTHAYVPFIYILLGKIENGGESNRSRSSAWWTIWRRRATPRSQDCTRRKARQGSTLSG